MEQIRVGEKMIAIYDKKAGSVKFYSDNGTLWNDWSKHLNADQVRSIQVVEGIVRMPEKCLSPSRN